MLLGALWSNRAFDRLWPRWRSTKEGRRVRLQTTRLTLATLAGLVGVSFVHSGSTIVRSWLSPGLAVELRPEAGGWQVAVGAVALALVAGAPLLVMWLLREPRKSGAGERRKGAAA